MDQRTIDAAKAAAITHVPPLLNITLLPIPESPPHGAAGLVLFGIHNVTGQRLAIKVQPHLGISVSP